MHKLSEGMPHSRTLMVGACLAFALLHAAHYRFLTDDAFISFRYALNLSEGHGLVFNPGFERVEGYTNFLWVLILAAVQRVTGLAPHVVANPLLLLATAAFWWTLYRYLRTFAIRRNDRSWLILTAPLCLAATRSFAVWSTSGLETRLFEALVFAGVLALLESIRGGGSPVRAALLFALASLTRPDGILFFLCAYGTWTLARTRSASWSARPAIASVAVFAALVGGHFLFRRAYYGEWLPNTYFVKVGEPWYDLGVLYVFSVLLEYGVYVWIPVLFLGIRAHVRAGSWYVPFLFGSLIIPHALYVVRIGGDHFEFRMLDLYFPYLLILFSDGLSAFATSIRRTAGAFAYLAAALWLIVALPLETHLQFPKSYQPGFPSPNSDEGNAFLRRDLPFPYRLPLFDGIADSYVLLLRVLSRHYVGLRQEEHVLFAERVTASGKLLREFVQDGVLPASTHIAICCVGAIPYYSGLRTFDRLGVNDREVARSPPVEDIRRIGHSRSATPEQAALKSVDFFSAHSVDVVLDATGPDFLRIVRRAVAEEREDVFLAELDERHVLVVGLPMGLGHAAARFPNLEFRSLARRAVAAEALYRAGTLTAPRPVDGGFSEVTREWMSFDEAAGEIGFPECGLRYTTCALREGNRLREARDYELALAVFERAGAFAPHQSRFAVRTALTLVDLGRRGEAAARIAEALEHPELGEEQRGELTRALRKLEEVRDPG